MYLSEALPELAVELRDRLVAVGEAALAESVPRLRVLDRCRCGDDFCATFYTAPPPRGAYGASHRNIDLEPEDGMIILDIEHEVIASVEVLFRDPVRHRLVELFP